MLEVLKEMIPFSKQRCGLSLIDALLLAWWIRKEIVPCKDLFYLFQNVYAGSFEGN